MTVEVTTDFSGPYITNGATTVFPFTFISMDGDEIGVLLRDVDGEDTVVSTSAYSVTRAADGTGSVVFASAPATGFDLYIFSDVSFAQSVEFEDGSGWKAAPVNSVADRSAARDIWLKGKLSRALVAPVGEALGGLPSIDSRLGKFLAFDAAGNPVAADGTGPDGGLRSDIAASTGASLIGFLQAGAAAEARTAQDKLRETYSIGDFPSFQSAIDDAPARGQRVYIPSGKTTLVDPLLVEVENVSINGASQKSSEIEIDHDDSGIKFEGQVNNLPDSKFALSDLYVTKKTGNTLDGSGYPQVGFVGTAVEIDQMYCGDVQRLQVERFAVGLDLSSVYMGTFNQYFARNCWMGLKCSTIIDGLTTGNTFTGGCFNNSAFDLTNGEKFTFIGTDFEASSTTCIVTSRNIFQNCRFERMHIGRSFFTWLDVQGDFNKFVGSQFFWDASTFAGNTTTDFYVTIKGDGNYLEAQKLFIHQNFVSLTSTSAGNTVLFNAPFTDYANTGSNNGYRRSGRLFIDKGTRNRIIFDNADGRIEVIGTEAMTAVGNLSNYLRYDPLSNLTINAATLTIAQSDIAGPCGIPASHVDNKKFTVASIASTIRARTPDLATADGSTVYSIGVFVYIPSGATQPTKVRIGDGSGVFTDIFSADGTDRWHWVPVFTQPANASTVQLMIEAEGEVNDVFYIALPSVGEGNIPAYVPPPRGKTSWTTKTTAKQIGANEIQALFGADETGITFTPATASFTGTVSTTTGQYTKRGDVVDFIIKLTGTSFSASAFVATVALPFTGGDGRLVINDTDATTNVGTGVVLNGTAYLPAVTATNSLQISGSYRLANV